MNKVEAMYHKGKTISEFSKSYFNYLSEIFKTIDLSAIESIAAEFESARENGNTIFVAGNGGSAVTASHMANDFGTDILKKSCTDKPFCVHSLTDNTAVMLAVANDDGYDNVFVN